MYSKFYFIKEYNCILEVKPVETIIEGSKSRVQKFYLYGHKSNISKLNKKIDNIIDDYNKRFHKNDIISLYNNGSFVRTISNNDIAKFNYISKYKSIICTQIKNHIKYFEESNMNHISNRGISFLLYGKPGTGKSSITKYILSKYKYNINNYTKITNISSFNSIISTGDIYKSRNELTNPIEIKKFSLILIDEIDLILRDDEEILSNFLSFLEDIPPECIVIITTNNPEKLPDSLKRDGRCDFKYEIKDFDENELQEYFKSINVTKEELEEFNRNINKKDKLESTNPAYLNNIYTQYCKYLKNEKIK